MHTALVFLRGVRVGLLALIVLRVLSAEVAAGDVTVGNVILKLPSPAGHCALDRGLDTDADLLEDIHEALRPTKIKLLWATADCTELKDWREGRRRFLGEIAQYQIMASFEAREASSNVVKSACDQLRAQGGRSSADIQLKAQTALEGVIKDVRVNEIRQWFMAEDAATCYAAQFQKSVVDGKPSDRLSINATTVVRGRLLLFFLSAPYGGKGLDALLLQHKANVAALHAANRGGEAQAGEQYAEMGGEQIAGYLVMTAVYGIPLLWLYFLVRRHVHPTRSKFICYLATLGLILGLIVSSIVVTMVVTVLAGYDLMRVPKHDPISKAIIGLGVGAVFGSILAGWQLAKRWMKSARAA